MLNWKWDRNSRGFKVGPRGFEVKGLVNPWRGVGGGLKGTKFGQWDPQGWPETTTKVGGVAWDLLQQGRDSPCRCVAWGVGPNRKILKTQWRGELKDEVLDYKSRKEQALDPNKQIRTNPWKNDIFCKSAIWLFNENLELWLFWDSNGSIGLICM